LCIEIHLYWVYAEITVWDLHEDDPYGSSPENEERVDIGKNKKAVENSKIIVPSD
jgi:hypothetical protein